MSQQQEAWLKSAQAFWLLHLFVRGLGWFCFSFFSLPSIELSYFKELTCHGKRKLILVQHCFLLPSLRTPAPYSHTHDLLPLFSFFFPGQAGQLSPDQHLVVTNTGCPPWRTVGCPPAELSCSLLQWSPCSPLPFPSSSAGVTLPETGFLGEKGSVREQPDFSVTFLPPGD